MSVVNKMLRDLDRRRPTGGAPDQPAAAAESTRGVAVVAEATKHAPGAGLSWRAGGALAVLLVTGVVSVVWWSRQTTAPPPGRVILPATVAAAPGLPTVSVVRPAPPPASVPTVAAPPSVADIATTAKPVGRAPERAATVPSLLRMEMSLKTALNDRPETVVAAVSPGASKPASVAQVTPPKAPPGAVGVTPGSAGLVQRQIAATEIVEQAQRLWNGGSREAAMGLLRDAALLAERDHVGAAPAAGQSVLSTLVRELVRMELAEGRVNQALERLVRLESALAGEADVWALRGNAAQRLGRHHESANAYLVALRLRPDQPRWMLGAAVSLAADGQVKAASNWAHSARERGALTPEVAAYLRQLGVNLAE